MTLSEAPGQSIYVKQWYYKGKTVDFALTHRIEETPGEYEHVMRYDCCHSEVHKHQYHRKRGEIDRKVIAPIDHQDTSWAVVDSAYDQCQDDAFDNWHEHYRRWNS